LAKLCKKRGAIFEYLRTETSQGHGKNEERESVNDEEGVLCVFYQAYSLQATYTLGTISE
jgi:hypothetical protein